MQPVARFVTRPSEKGGVDLILGAAFSEQTSLKPDTVYEIRGIFGEFVIVELGESQLSGNYNESKYGKWGHDVGYLMTLEGGKLILTAEEYEKLKQLDKEYYGHE